MNLAPIQARMETFPAALDALLHGLSAADASWRHDGEAWSIVEIVDHLVDEEMLDFGVRLGLVLDDPAKDWPAIDPEGVVAARRDGEHDLGIALRRFGKLRATSVEWLGELGEDVDWERAKEHPRLGRLSAGELLASWADHDVLHLRQVADRLHRLVGRDAGFGSGYAGPW